MQGQNGKQASGGISRRDFIKTSAFLGGAAAMAAPAPWLLDVLTDDPVRALDPTAAYPLSRPENIIYTVCQQCNTQCGIKAKIHDGVIVKIDGNPYSPWTAQPHTAYKTPVAETAIVDGFICPKGQASVQTSYDPYRIVKVLKRAGPRGSNQWQTIAFDKAIDEIVTGGKLFANVKGEENREIAGLKDLWALRDAKVAKAMADDVKTILAKKTPEEKQKAIADFKSKHKDNLDKLIDPDHPDLGPKNNQVNFTWGRLKGGRSDFIQRFFGDSLGTINRHGHTTVCQGSLYFTGKAMSEQYKDGKWADGKKFFWQADLESAEFVIFVGVNPFEASQGPSLRASRITQGMSEGRLKYAVIDPRLSRTASKAWKWLPIMPGEDLALALAITRWIIEQKRFDAKYLANANKAAAAADKEPTWSNASWLVKIEKDGTPGKFARGSELGIAKKESRPTADGKGTYEFDPFVVLKDGKPTGFDANDTKTAVEGDLLATAEINGVKVKTALQVILDNASTKTIEEWAGICGLNADDIIELAREFTSHGKKAVVDIHRGVSQHTNGLFGCSAWLSLNTLVGNIDWRGGASAGSSWDAAGTKEGQPYPVASLHPAKAAPFGIDIIRTNTKYEESTLFANYPAKRQWYPLASDIYQEILTSGAAGYPYQLKAVFLYMGTPAYALPAGHTQIAALADPEKIPLVIASDIVIGETSMYADYIFPDAANLERWEMAGTQFSVIWKVQPIRQPAMAPPNEVVKVFGEEMPVSLEAMLLGLAEKLGLPGFGPDGFGQGQPFTRPEDFYLKMAANVAFGEKKDGSEAVPDASDEEMTLFATARSHIAKHTFDLERWAKAVKPDVWRKTVFVLNRGGRFDDYENAYDGQLLKRKYGAQVNLYQEKTATTKNAMSGKYYTGMPVYGPTSDLAGNPINDEGYDLRLITHKEVSQTKSRTVANYWLQSLLPEGLFAISSTDARRLKLKTGDKARIVSATNNEGAWDLKNGSRKSIEGTVKVIEGIRPGVVTFSLGHGHWAYGSADVVVDGETIRGDPRRGKGIHANAAMRTDPLVPDMCLTDPIGASAVFHDTRVKLEKV